MATLTTTQRLRLLQLQIRLLGWDNKIQKSNPNHDERGRFSFGKEALDIAKRHEAIIVSSVFKIPSKEFSEPSKNWVLPPLCKKARDALGGDNRRVLLKNNILKRQIDKHSEIVRALKNMAVINNALYYTVKVLCGNRNNEYYVAIKMEGGDYYTSTIDTTTDSDYIEIVDWRIVNEEGYRRMKNCHNGRTGFNLHNNY